MSEMRVFAHLKAFYDYVPVPEGVDVKPKDIADGRARMNRDGSAWMMRVRKTVDTHNFAAISEQEIARYAIACAMPKRGSRRMTRRELVADYLATQPYVDAFDHSYIKHFEVHDDTGPDEALFRAECAPYLEAKNPSTGAPLLTQADVETMVKLYLEPVDEKTHVDHLHNRFGVPPKKVTP